LAGSAIELALRTVKATPIIILLTFFMTATPKLAMDSLPVVSAKRDVDACMLPGQVALMAGSSSGSLAAWAQIKAAVMNPLLVSCDDFAHSCGEASRGSGFSQEQASLSQALHKKPNTVNRCSTIDIQDTLAAGMPP
jgi:hypothetical protein